MTLFQQQISYFVEGFSLTTMIYYLITVLLGILIYLIYRRGLINEFSSKIVFITGCDSGFGHSLALKLDSMGLKVYAGCLTNSGASKLQQISSCRLKTVHIDLRNSDTITKAKLWVEEDLNLNSQCLWGLVNIAGCIGNVCFDFSDVNDYRQTHEVNFFGTIQVIETFLPLLKKSRGRCVTVTSILQRAMFGACPYTASKAALGMYCDGLRRFVRLFGIHSSIIEPGFYPSTNLIRESGWVAGMEQQWSNLLPEVRKDFGDSYKDQMIVAYRRLFARAPFHWWNKNETVIESLVHALGGKIPKDRYVCGWDAQMTRLISFVPDWLLDKTLQQVVKDFW
ncbi:hypothetical protein CHUAL_008416 [Chamberlinius hualienensis]